MDDVRRMCPRCNSDKVLPILYGLPSDEMVEASVRGKIALGGCAVFPGNPDYTCNNCGHEWREDDE